MFHFLVNVKSCINCFLNIGVSVFRHQQSDVFVPKFAIHTIKTINVFQAKELISFTKRLHFPVRFQKCELRC